MPDIETNYLWSTWDENFLVSSCFDCDTESIIRLYVSRALSEISCPSCKGSNLVQKEIVRLGPHSSFKDSYRARGLISEAREFLIELLEEEDFGVSQLGEEAKQAKKKLETVLKDFMS